MKILTESNIQEKLITLDTNLVLDDNCFTSVSDRQELEKLMNVVCIISIEFTSYYSHEDVDYYEYIIKYQEK